MQENCCSRHISRAVFRLLIQGPKWTSRSAATGAKSSSVAEINTEIYAARYVPTLGYGV